jgi:hypothetical protein
MSNSKNPGFMQSRSTYKKLGTIIEHLVETVNPFLYEIRIASNPQPQCTAIRIYPFPHQGNMYPGPIWELIWNPYFNSKLYIDEILLLPNAEW